MVDGGKHYWIEPRSQYRDAEIPLTDDETLRRSDATFKLRWPHRDVGADDNPPGTPDLDYDDMILVLEYKDSAVNPPDGWQKPYDFTIPREIVEPD